MSTEPSFSNRLTISGLSIGLGLLYSGCLELQDDTPAASRECSACHGDSTRKGGTLTQAAPPFDTDGRTRTSARGVGAHAWHLNTTGHALVTCSECHVVPKSVFSKGHIDSGFPAELTFGKLAKQDGHRPSYDAKSQNCTDNYCHGNSMAKWTEPRKSDKACGSCHGLPPSLPHPQKQDCSQCHGEVIAANRSWKRPTLHVNGHVEVEFSAGCASCHGRGDSGAPPPDLSGSDSPSSPGTGAHAIHLVAGPTHGVVACNQCHSVPTAVDQAGHLDGDNRAEVVFGSLATTGDRSPTYTTQNQRCESTYCHGGASPNWTNPRSSTQACGSCHLTPPALPHPQNQECAECHSAVMGPNATFVHPELHVDGTVQRDTRPVCSQCHGSGEDGAVPPDLSGNTTPSARGVGAHAMHLAASASHGKLACAECHLVPATVDALGHLDGDGRADITFGALAQQNGMNPTYSPTDVRCSNTYCHGTVTANWQSPRNSTDSCGSCHALPPALPHPPTRGSQPLNDCARCHGAVVDQSGQFVQPELHVNGTLELNTSDCSLCHGSATNAAPPFDLSGSSDKTRVSVGAHQIHLAGGNSSRPVACDNCHVVPTNLDHAGSTDSWSTPATVTFSGPATARGRLVTWDRTNGNCNNSYCHDPSGTGVNPPTWIAADATLTCTSCHQMPPVAPHTTLTQCSFCHSDVDSQNRITNKSRHIDGTVDF